jgi:dihydroorotate dehydrogenase
MLYDLLRPLVFQFDPETAHHLALDNLDRLHRLGLTCLLTPRIANRPRTLMGLTFPNPVGLAAGMDKNGAHIDALAALGFGFIEVGTVTPRPQPGNPRPRLFRLPEARAIINRMGFNNDGVDALLANVRRMRYRGILGINIGKNFDTPIENAVDDYLICFTKVYPHASYVTVNISSPNTKNLRQLQQADELERLLAALAEAREGLAREHARRVPLVLKIAPDLDTREIIAIADLLLKYRLDGVIATNTTLARDGVERLPLGAESGGLSGAPLRARSTAVVKQLALALEDKLPIIGAGGILDALDAEEKIRAGASLVQLYSGLIYRGPELVAECRRALG